MAARLQFFRAKPLGSAKVRYRCRRLAGQCRLQGHAECKMEKGAALAELGRLAHSVGGGLKGVSGEAILPRLCLLCCWGGRRLNP